MRLLRGRHPLSLVALTLALVCGALWVFLAYAPSSDGYTITLPVAPGRTLHVVAWSRERIFIGTEFNHGAMVDVSDVLTVAFWYQNNRAVTARHLLTTRLPSWPLLVAAGCCLSLALAIGRRRLGSSGG